MHSQCAVQRSVRIALAYAGQSRTPGGNTGQKTRSGFWWRSLPPTRTRKKAWMLGEPGWEQRGLSDLRRLLKSWAIGLGGNLGQPRGGGWHN